MVDPYFLNLIHNIRLFLIGIACALSTIICYYLLQIGEIDYKFNTPKYEKKEFAEIIKSYIFFIILIIMVVISMPTSNDIQRWGSKNIIERKS